MQKRLMQHLENNGQSVWTENIVVGAMRLARPHIWTSYLANEFHRRRLDPKEPESWVVRFTPQKVCLFLREGEYYNEAGNHHFKPPVKVGIKSMEEYVELCVTPQDMWWQAQFVCPYCGVLCIELAKCCHSLVCSGYVQPAFHDTEFYSLFKEMWNRRYHCNLPNARITGMVVKESIDLWCREWFRTVYIYIEHRGVLQDIEQILSSAKAKTC